MIIAVNGHELNVELAGNSSARALVELLNDGVLHVDMQDYSGFEKVGPLPQRLPTNDRYITTESGDVILYQGKHLVINYGPNSWSLTRLGRITGVSSDQLHQILGDGDVTVTLRGQ